MVNRFKDDELLNAKEAARMMEGIRCGLEDLEAGRTIPLDRAFADMRRKLKLPKGK